MVDVKAERVRYAGAAIPFRLETLMVPVEMLMVDSEARVARPVSVIVEVVMVPVEIEPVDSEARVARPVSVIVDAPMVPVEMEPVER